ncbi:MAG: hypothetical protein QNJ97_16880 [Myxococcota bacterium]|nr:hypothetical protein [Myxococcota bacterium]
MRKTALIVIVGLVACTAVFVLGCVDSSQRVAASDDGADQQDEEEGNEEEDEALNALAVAKLKELYGERISHPQVQLQASEKLLRYLAMAYPNQWQARIPAYAAAAFPGYGATVHDKCLKLIDFRKSIQENSDAMADMNADDRKAFIQAKRAASFGDEVSVIWEMEHRGEEVAALLREIKGQLETSFASKVDVYITRLNAIYGDQTKAQIDSNTHKLMNQFLALVSVQGNLVQMTPEKRKENLAQFRKKMGLDPAAVARWTDLDALRDKRWEAGKAYMAARAEILDERFLTEAAAEEKLDALRQEHFGAAADTIKHEEKAGLFRFDRKRVFGRN